MNQMAEYAQGTREAFELEAEGSKAEGPRDKGWRRVRNDSREWGNGPATGGQILL